MNFIGGEHVKYKSITGMVSFVSSSSISILVRRGRHKSQDVNVVVYSTDFDQIEILDEK